MDGTLTKYAYGRNGALTYEEFWKDGAKLGSRSYAYLNDQIIGFTDFEGGIEQKRFAVTDILGSVTQIYSESNDLLWETEYSAFGIPDAATTDKFEGIFEFYGMFTGCQYDIETGLSYHWNRWRSETGCTWLTEDPARDGIDWYAYCSNNPLVFTDPDGLNTLDDFYYQKVTNAETKEDKENYLQQQTQSWKGNQGLSEYGKIVETFQEFAESNFNQENPLEQNELDKLLGYNKKLGISTSCMLAAIINAYASLFKNGITGLQIINSLFDGDDNIFKYIGVDKNSNAEYSFYCENLWNFSYALADSMDARAKDFVDYSDSSEDNTKVFLQTSSNKKFEINYGCFSPTEFQKMIFMSMTQGKSKYTISGLVDYRDYSSKMLYKSSHYVFVMNNKIVDSLDPDRDKASFYTPNSYYNLNLQKRY